MYSICLASYINYHTVIYNITKLLTGGNLNARGEYDLTALHLASLYGHSRQGRSTESWVLMCSSSNSKEEFAIIYFLLSIFFPLSFSFYLQGVQEKHVFTIQVYSIHGKNEPMSFAALMLPRYISFGQHIPFIIPKLISNFTLFFALLRCFWRLMSATSCGDANFF